MKPKSRRLFKAIFLIVFGFALIAVGFTDLYIGCVFFDRVFENKETIPARPVGLLLGTAKAHRGRSNPFYDARIRAAAELFHAGKIRAIIVSDSGRAESAAMKNDLVRMGVPENRIASDTAGFRTLDSIVRAEKVFGQKAYTIISQDWHSKRALFISNKYRHDTIAYCAKDVKGLWASTIRMRETFARIKTVLDIHVLNKQPGFIGPPVRINTNSA